ncbi:VapE domain-containing protein [Paraburkholderia sp. BL9I2N2]|uniref:VapE domain-containing protein n=1 Tax=Paraburkholderia sp. BL9I2N2 TaxID=1938809 RepID=UPI00104EF9A9|nr:VapE domain-containing protein [Paraburkholderia sp. BL9I2N2]TCK96265.1 putative P-loop ATPase [Paraburkholderia sp. BL9I2N2]
MSSLEQIVQQLEADGHPKLPDGHPIADGKPHRYGAGKKYWYSLHQIERAGKVLGYTGAFGRWSGNDNGAQTFQWQGEALTPEDVNKARQRQQAADRAEAEKKAHAAKLAANRARDQWQRASDDGTSGYLDRKQITPEGVRFDSEGTVLVPMFQYADSIRLVGLQKITPDGAKRFNKGMEKKGAAYLLGEISDDDKVAMVAEGYATGRSIRMATGEAIPLSICFDAGGILPAARYLRDVYPDLHLLICADDDWKIDQRLRDCLAEEFGYTGELAIGGDAVRVETKNTWYRMRAVFRRDDQGVGFIELSYGNDVAPERRKRFENAGLRCAFEAVADVGNASVVFPRFAGRGDRKLTDFNDLHCEEGLEPVRQQIQSALFAALALAAQDIPLAAPMQDQDLAGDPLYDRAVAVVRAAPRASVSLVQRELRIGFNRAARLIERMASDGVVSDESPNGTRSVIDAANVERATSAGAATEENGGHDVENGAHTWERDLARSDKGNLLPTLGNVHLILSNHKSWQGVIAQDDFAGRVVKRKRPPFAQGEVGEWSDMDDIRCVLWLSQKYGISVRQDIVMSAVLLVADATHFHDVREYLECVVWDGVERVRTWATRYMKVADSEYVQLAGTKWLIAAVARVMRPGCKADNVLILEGKQGWYKSTALEVIAGKPWYTNSPIRIGDKDTYAVMAGKWIIELAELDSLNKSDSSAAKSFFATETDRFRNFYGKRATDVHRQGVFAGSVNFDTYLKDESGNRRYWPLRVGGPILIDDLRRDRDQLWAEAVHLYRQGVIWHVTEAEKPLFESEQTERYEGDVYEDRIARDLELRSRVTMEEILADILKLDTSKWTLPEQRRVGKALKSLGWVRKRESTGRRDWYYVKEDEAPAPVMELATQGADDDAPL